jgi:hypothetical protein
MRNILESILQDDDDNDDDDDDDDFFFLLQIFTVWKIVS